MDHPYKKEPSFGVVDLVVTIIVAAGFFIFFSRMKSIVGYEWDWSIIPDYIIRKDDAGNFKLNLLMLGFITTLKLSFWAGIIAVFLGVFFGLMRSNGSPGQKFSGFVYVETIRNIPSLVLVFIFYFFVSSQFLDKLGLDVVLGNSPESVQRIVAFLFTDAQKINSFVSAVITLGIYEGAYVTEIVRGGLAGVPEGQWDAGYALGLSKFQTFIYVILPQAMRSILSPMAGQFISTIKDSAIMSVISIQELTFQGMEIMSATFLTFEIWITITFLYFILTFSLSFLFGKLEERYLEHV